MDLDDLLDEVLNDPRNGGVNAGQPKQTSFQPPAEQSQQIRYSDQNAGSSYQPRQQQVATNNSASQMQSNNFGGGSGYGVRSSIQAAATNGADDDDDWDAEDDQPAPS